MSKGILRYWDTNIAIRKRWELKTFNFIPRVSPASALEGRRTGDSGTMCQIKPIFSGPNIAPTICNILRFKNTWTLCSKSYDDLVNSESQENVINFELKSKNLIFDGLFWFPNQSRLCFCFFDSNLMNNEWVWEVIWQTRGRVFQQDL